MFNLIGKLRTQEALKMRCETRTSLGPPLFVNQTDVSQSRRHALTADASTRPLANQSVTSVNKNGSGLQAAFLRARRAQGSHPYAGR